VNQSKQLKQARLLGRCLTGILTINLTLVGVACWTQLGTTPVEAQGTAEAAIFAPISGAIDAAAKPSGVPAKAPQVADQAEPSVPPPAIAPKPAANGLAKASTSASDPPAAPPAKSTQIVVAPPESVIPTLFRLANPGDTGGVVYYSVDGKSFSLSPGEYHEISQAAECLVEFHRGGDFGYAKLQLKAGDYLFVVGARGWDLTLGKAEPSTPLIRAN
jgi:hypothetical protein